MTEDAPLDGARPRMTSTWHPRASIVIPVKGLVSGKSRLATVLSPAEREALNRYLAERTLEIALKTALATEADIAVYIVSPDETVADIARARKAHFLHQAASGLNAGLAEAVARLPACRTVFLAADLPNLAQEDIEALLNTQDIGLAPDQAQSGTNALSVPEPATLPFSFGPDSMQHHIASARKLGRTVQIIQRPGISFDLDTKDDLERLKGWP